MVINPYSNVNWNTVQMVVSISHAHCTTQAQFDQLLQNSNLKHIALSNYYPSDPYYPLASYFTVPSGVIGSPNAEHHTMTSRRLTHYGKLHLNGLGSTFSSGSAYGSTPVGCDGALCEDIIPLILSDLQYEDGGGITINHPCWSNLTAKDICYLLDLDERIIGQEIYNQTCVDGTGNDDGNPYDTEVNIRIWDEVLLTGRRCWGFAVPDHNGKFTADWKGKNILLVDEMTEEKCLKAYRNGQFFTREGNTALVFNSITFENGTLSVRSNSAGTIIIIVDGKRSVSYGQSASLAIPEKATYVRVEATGLNDHIYSNPIMLKTREEKKKEEDLKEMILKASTVMM